MKTEIEYICIKNFEGFTGIKYDKGVKYQESDIHIRHQSNFTKYFELINPKPLNRK